MNFPELKQKVESLKMERDLRSQTLAGIQKKIKDLKGEQIDLQESQQILQVVGQATQKELEYHVSELVTLAMEAVFPRPYKLALDFVLRRNKSEADFSFVRNEQKIEPLLASGGGPVDVASFALRVSLWSLQRPKTRATIILDEPFRFLSRDLQDRASQMLKEISDRLGLQMIIVTHEPNLLERADKIFKVSNVKGKSIVEEGGEE